MSHLRFPAAYSISELFELALTPTFFTSQKIKYTQALGLVLYLSRFKNGVDAGYGFRFQVICSTGPPNAISLPPRSGLH